jgi:alpha-beta hydrolase superfamily lysophospholipase
MTRSAVPRAALVVVGVLAACSSNAGPPGASTASPPGLSVSTSAAAGPTAPPSLRAACGSTSGVRARSMWFRASDGVRLYGIEAGAGRTVVVLAHEGRADLCGWLPYVHSLQQAGLRVFAFDFRGNGQSESPSAYLALGRDLAGAVARVRAEGARDVFLIGASMGGAAVVQNTAGMHVTGRISLSGTRLWPGYGVNDPVGVRRISAPFLYVGSRDDSNAPLDEARTIFRRIGAATSGSSSTRARRTAGPWWKTLRTAPARAR